MRELRETLEKTRDTVEEQDRQLFDKTTLVSSLNKEICCKENFVREQDALLQVWSVLH